MDKQEYPDLPDHRPFYGLAAPKLENEPQVERRVHTNSLGFENLTKNEELKHEEIPQPQMMRKIQSSDSGSSVEDGTYIELQKRDFSISIPEHEQIEDKGIFTSSYYTVYIV